MDLDLLSMLLYSSLTINRTALLFDERIAGGFGFGNMNGYILLFCVSISLIGSCG